MTLLCTLLNRQPTEYEASVTLAGEGKEGEYAFVHVEQFGYVVSYNPRTTEGKVRWEKSFDFERESMSWDIISFRILTTTSTSGQRARGRSGSRWQSGGYKNNYFLC